jgi:hypothetical protein
MNTINIAELRDLAAHGLVQMLDPQSQRARCLLNLKPATTERRISTAITDDLPGHCLKAVDSAPGMLTGANFERPASSGAGVTCAGEVGVPVNSSGGGAGTLLEVER